MTKFNNHQLSFFIGRLALGMNFMFHGIARLGQVEKFAQGVAKGFQETFFPESLAYAYGLFIPYFELVLGFSIALGLFTRSSLFVAGIFMTSLIIGMCLQQQWGTVGTQMIYIIVIFLLLKSAEHDTWYLKK